MMKRAAFSLLSLVLGLGILSAARASGHDHRQPLPVQHSSLAAGAIARALSVVAPLTTPPDEGGRADLRRRVRDAAAGTYMDEILLERDSSLARWPDRAKTPLKVWVQPRSSVRDFTAEYVNEVRSAFSEWDALRLPVHFAFVRDSSHADVHVSFIDHFDEPISGRTRWTRDDNWMITDANITLAVHHHLGEQLDSDAMRAMALHEIGHLLGLDHTTDSLSIMAPRVRVRSLSSADRATVRLLYALPPGPLR